MVCNACRSLIDWFCVHMIDRGPSTDPNDRTPHLLRKVQPAPHQTCSQRERSINRRHVYTKSTIRAYKSTISNTNSSYRASYGGRLDSPAARRAARPTARGATATNRPLSSFFIQNPSFLIQIHHLQCKLWHANRYLSAPSRSAAALPASPSPIFILIILIILNASFIVQIHHS